MARPKTVTDEEIYEAARAVFVEHGAGASVSLVAKRLGVSHAALFQRAGSKEKLMLNALRPDLSGVIDVLLMGPPLEGTRVALIRILRDLMSFFRQLIPQLVVLKSAGLSFDLEGREAPPVMMRRLLSTWLASAVERGCLSVRMPDAVAEGLLGALEARCFNAYIGGDAYVLGEDDVFLASLVAGLVQCA